MKNYAIKSHGIVKKCYKSVNIYVIKSHDVVTKKSHGNANLCNKKSRYSKKIHQNANLYPRDKTQTHFRFMSINKVVNQNHR